MENKRTEWFKKELQIIISIKCLSHLLNRANSEDKKESLRLSIEYNEKFLKSHRDNRSRYIAV